MATLFEVESNTNYGNGVVHIASSNDLQGIDIVEGNFMKSYEKEVGVSMLPTEFERAASTTISVQDSSKILKEMGYDVPANIYDKTSLGEYLRANTPLTDDQINDYLKKVDNAENIKGSDKCQSN